MSTTPTDSVENFVCPNCDGRVRQFTGAEICDCGYAPPHGAD